MVKVFLVSPSWNENVGVDLSFPLYVDDYDYDYDVESRMTKGRDDNEGDDADGWEWWCGKRRGVMTLPVVVLVSLISRQERRTIDSDRDDKQWQRRKEGRKSRGEERSLHHQFVSLGSSDITNTDHSDNNMSDDGREGLFSFGEDRESRLVAWEATSVSVVWVLLTLLCLLTRCYERRKLGKACCSFIVVHTNWLTD